MVNLLMRRKTLFLLFNVTLAIVQSFLIGLPADAKKPESKTITICPMGDTFDYTPTLSAERSAANPYPRQQIRKLADQWEKLHPGYRIEIVRAPAENYRAWMVSNFVGGSIPHIINMSYFKDADYRKGWVVKMDPYLEQPNPYVKGNARWSDLFYKEYFDGMRSLDGNAYFVGIDLVGVGIIYNKSILDQAGIKKLPRTLKDFLDTCKRVREAGFLAYLPEYEWYLDGAIPACLWSDVIHQIDTDHNRTVSQPEMTAAVQNGKVRFDDPRGHEYLRIAAQLMENYPKGWNTMDPLYMFRNGKVAFMEGLTAHMRQIASDPHRRFEYGIIPFPEITISDSPFGGAPIAGGGIASYSTNWQITNTAQRDGVVDAAVDFLRYLTTPENNAALVNEIAFMIPGIKGAEVSTLFKPLLQRALLDLKDPRAIPWHTFGMITYTNEFTDNWYRVKENVALGVINDEEAAEQAQFWIERAAKSVRRKQIAEQGIAQ